MDTKKFKINGAEKAKGGKHFNHKIIATTGTATIGGFVAGASFSEVTGSGKDNKPTEPTGKEETEQQASAAAIEESVAQQSQPLQEPIQQPQVSDEYQPTDNGQTADIQPQTPQQSSDNTPSIAQQEEINPDDVAQAIAQEIDQQDIDADNVLTIDEFGTANGPDGSEILVAVAHTPDGQQFMLTDFDGDGVFTDVFDMAGNFAGNLEGHLTAGDLIDMYDTSGGYLAVNENVVGDDPTNGIVNTESNEMAQQTTAPADGQATDEQLSDEELLAQLTDEVGDDDNLIDRLIEDDTEVSDDDNTDSDETEDEVDDVIDGGIDDGE